VLAEFSAELGVSVAVKLLALYVTVDATGLFEVSRSWKVLLVRVVASIASLNVALTFDPVLTPVAPLAGVIEVTNGPEVSVALVANTTSTQ